MLLDKIWTRFAFDIAIDLGTANTKVLVAGKGIVVREPSVVVLHKKTKEILTVGDEAKRMMGKTPGNLLVVRPLRDGVISDFDVTASMLAYFIRKVHESFPSFLPRIPRPRVVIGIPSGVTEVERKAVVDAALRAGSRKVYLIEEPMAGALGANLPVQEPQGSLIVDIGGGTSEVAIIALGGVVVSKSLRVAGDEMDEGIVAWARNTHNLLIGERTAEDLKIRIGDVCSDDMLDETRGKMAVLRGRDLESGLPVEKEVGSADIKPPLMQSVRQIISAVKEAIEETPPELLADIYQSGVTLVGGGSLLSGLDRLIAEEVKIPVQVANEPILAVVRGLGKALSDLELLEKVRL